MRIGDIVSLLKEYAVLGVMAIIVCGVLFWVGYKVVYQKMMKGTKTILKKKMVLYGVTILYAIIVLGAVFLNRGNIYGNANFQLFYSYREAYHKMELSLFRNNVLNMLLFVPFGVLLPCYSEKFRKFYKVVFLGLLSSILIETVQYVTKIGIFEIDDIFNNTVGVLIGYCFWGIVNCIWKKEKQQYILGYILPMIIVIAVFTGIYIQYQNQELGNLPFEYNEKVNMKSVRIENKVKLSKLRQKKDIYYISPLTKEETRRKADIVFSKLGTKTEEEDLYENTAIYYSENREYSIWVEFQDGSYSFTDFSHFGKEGEKVEKKSKASREEIEKALEKLGVVVPEMAVFQEEENGYRFSIHMQIEGDTLQNGDITCTYYEDGTIQNMRNGCITYGKVKEKQIISEEEAYMEIANGRFQYDDHLGKLETMVIEDVKLTYDLDSKGYYVPVYVFQANINGQSQNIKIKAVSKTEEEITNQNVEVGELEILSYQGTFYAKGVVVRPEVETLTIMPTVSNEEYRYEEKFYYENMQVTNLKQGQEVSIRFHYRNAGGDYLHEPVIEQVEVIKEKSERQIPRDILVKAYSSEDKVSVTLHQEKSNAQKLECTITDHNELTYDYSIMEYNIYRYNPPPTKTENPYTNFVAAYDPWPEVKRISNISTQNHYTISPNGQLPIKLDWSEIYGKLGEGKYKLTLATVSAKRQSIINPQTTDYPCDGIVIDIEFTIDKDGKIEYGQTQVR